MRVLSNAELEHWVIRLRERYNLGVPVPVLRLFRNDLDLSAELETTQFMEANFPTYEPFGLIDQWGQPFKASDGVWECRTQVVTFSAPAGEPANRIFGAYLTLDGQWSAAERFTVPVDIVPGGTALVVRGRLTLRDDHSYQVGVSEE